MTLAFNAHSAILATAPQLDPDDAAAVRAAGFAAVMNNRPDFEHDSDQPTAQAVGAAMQAQGLAFVNLPFSPNQIDEDLARKFAQQVATMPQPVLLYCRSGSRAARIYQIAVALGYLNPDDLSCLSPNAD